MNMKNLKPQLSIVANLSIAYFDQIANANSK